MRSQSSPAVWNWKKGQTFFFQPRALKNLVLVDEIDSLAQLCPCQIADLANEDTPQTIRSLWTGSLARHCEF